MVISQRILADSRSDKITRDHFCSLMDELVERVLSVGTRLTPDDRTCLIHNGNAVSVNRLSIALHVSLLKISGKPVQVLVVRQNCFGCCAKKIVVPHADQ